MRAWIEPLGWMLVHSVWLIALIAGVAAVAMTALRRRSAAARYAVGSAALVLSLATLPGTLIWVVAQRSNAPVVAEPVRIESWEGTDVRDVPNIDVATLRDDEWNADQRLVFPTTEPSTSESFAAVPQTPFGPFRPSVEPTAPPLDPTIWQRIEARLRPHLPSIVVVWFVGVLLLSVRPLIGWHSARRLRRVGLSEVSESLQEIVRRLALRLGLRRAVKIFQSSLVQIPCVVGALKPVILLPASAISGLSPEQLEALLAHELAHIRRHDFAVNLVQTMVETLLFYHPAIWWLSRRVRQEREHCCDDLAISVCGDVAGYARMLVSVEGLRGRVPQTSVAASGGSLVERIRRLLPPSPEQTWSPWMAVVMLLATLMVLVGSWQWTAGQNLQVPEETGKSARPTVSIPATTTDGSQARLIVEWSAVVDDDIVQSIRQLKPVGGKSQLPANGSLTRCSADELRAVIRLRLGEQKKIVSGTYAHFILPTPPGFRTKRDPWDRGGDVFEDDRDELHGRLMIHGKRSFEDQENVAKLQLDIHNRFSGRGLGDFEVSVQFNDSLNNGEALALTASPKNNADAKAAVVCVYESLIVPSRDVEWMRRLSRCDDWIRLGPAGMKQRIERASDWRARTTKDVRAIDPKWTRDLPNGGHVQLVALSRPAQAPLVWWTPDGKAISGIDPKSHLSLWRPDFWALVRVWEEGARRDLLHVTSAGDWKNGVQELPIDDTTAGSQLVIVPATLLKREGQSLLRIGTGFGPWTAETRLDATAGASATLGKLTVKTEEVFEANVITGVNLTAPRTLNRFRWTPIDDIDVTVLAVRQKGRLTPEANPLVVVNEAPKHSTEFEHAVSKEAIEHFIVKTRPRSWAEFTGFAIEPAEPLNPPLDFGKEVAATSAGHGSPDPTLNPTAGLPNSADDAKTTNNANGDLRSSPAAGSGDPRRAQDVEPSSKPKRSPNPLVTVLQSVPEKAVLDATGEVMPTGMVQRLGSTRFKVPGWWRRLAFAGNDEWVWIKADDRVSVIHRETGRVVKHQQLRLGEGSVRMLTVSPDGTQVAIGMFEPPYPSDNYRVVVMSALTTAHLQELKWNGQWGDLSCLSFSGDGGTLLTATGRGDVRLWDVETGKQLRQQAFAELADLRDAAMSSDGRSAVLASWGASLLWKRADNVAPIKLAKGHSNSVAFAPNGRVFATINSTGVRLWNGETGELVALLLSPDVSYRDADFGIAFTPDSRILAVPVVARDLIELWDVETKKRLATLPVHQPRGVAISRDGRWLAASGQDSITAIFDLKTRQQVSQPGDGHAQEILSVRFADASSLVSSSTGDARVWDIKSGQQQQKLAHEKSSTTVRGLAASPDGSLIVTSGFDGTLGVWDRASGKRLHTLKGHGHFGGSRAVQFQTDGRQFVSWGDDAVLRWWDAKDATLLKELTLDVPSYKYGEDPQDALQSFSLNAAFAPDANSLFVSFDGLFEFDTRTGQRRRRVPSNRSVVSTAISPDGRWLATAERDKYLTSTIVLRDRTTLAVVREWLVRDPQDVVATVNSRAMTRFSATGGGGMAFSPDSKHLAWPRAGARHAIDIAEVANDRLVASIPVESPCWCLDFSPDGTRIATGHENSTVCLWELKHPAFAIAEVKGLEFLKPYPKLHGLSLDMTEPQFLEIIKQQELKTRKTVDGEKVTHHIALDDDHTLIVMFDKDSKCRGIQRVRGDDMPRAGRGLRRRRSITRSRSIFGIGCTRRSL